MTAFVFILLAVGAAISLLATAGLVHLGRRLGALDVPGATGHHKVLRDVPNIGGVAIFLAIAGPMVAGLLATLLLPEAVGSWHPALAEHLPRLVESAPLAWMVLLGMVVLHGLGVVDDRRPLGPSIKILVQLAAAIPVVALFDVRILTVLDGLLPLGSWPSAMLTVAWILVVVNAINYLDNMDGLAAGVCAIVGSILLAAALIGDQWFIASVLSLVVGAMLGFLPFNIHPARIFMGDGGSLVLGFLFAVLTARTTFYDPSEPGGGSWYGVLMPLAVLAIPLYDLVLVTFLRVRQGRNPLVGDQQHFSHRIARRGLAPRRTVAIVWAATAATGIGAVVLGTLRPWQAVLVGVQVVLILLVIGLLEHAGRNSIPGSDQG